jgi:uncharacterized membrane protein
MAKKETKPAFDFSFGKENYLLMIVGIAVIFLGFILMAGGGSENPAEFDESVFSTRRITVAPLLVVLGFVIEVFAIIRKPKD